MITIENLPEYIKKAERGDMEAQFQLGQYYNVGIRLGFDFPMIESFDADVYWFIRAEENGHNRSKYILKRLKGLGVKTE